MQPNQRAQCFAFGSRVFLRPTKAPTHQLRNAKGGFSVAAALKEEQSLNDLEAACKAYKRAPPSEVSNDALLSYGYWSIV